MAAPEPQAEAKPSYIPIVTDAARLLRVFYSPGKMFEEQQAKPTWFLPWLVIAIVVIIVGLVQAPYTERTIQLALASRTPAPQVPPGTIHIQAMVGSVVAPIFFLIFALIGAGIMYLIAMLGGSSVRYRGMLSATVFAMAITCIQYIVSALIVRMRGAPEAAIQSIYDAQPALGLNLFLPADNTSGFLWAFLGGIGPFPIWALAITAIGIMKLEKAKTGIAWAAAIGSYVIVLLVGASLAGMQR